jgi:hypothetical protein
MGSCQISAPPPLSNSCGVPLTLLTRADFVNKFTGGDQKQNEGQQQQQQGGEQKQGGGFLGGIGDKINSAAGGGKESEKNEDYLDKGEVALVSVISCRC